MNESDAAFVERLMREVPDIYALTEALRAHNDRMAQIDLERDENERADAAEQSERMFPRYPDANDPRR